jgi:DNA-nicking Smr family endonuclease
MTDNNNIWLEYIKSVKKIDNNSIQKATHNEIITNNSIEPDTPEHGSFFNSSNKQSILALPFGYTNKRRRKQTLPIEDKLDLHGLTQDQAFEKLNEFLRFAYHNNKKHVLIITGKGALARPGAIKLAVPRWLQHTEIKQYILSYSMARHNQGGEGAISVLLKTK